jgi:hypothetical protein
MPSEAGLAEQHLGGLVATFRLAVIDIIERLRPIVKVLGARVIGMQPNSLFTEW